MKISIITVCRNAGKTIERTIQSVLCQKNADFEYIVIDGVSEDNTLEIINKYKDKITNIISEPDSGLYDAMNKGIKIAQGDYLMFLNADDVFLHEEVLSLVSEQIQKSKADLYYGDLGFLEKTNGKFTHRKQDSVGYVYLCGGMLFHPTIFASKKLFEKFGSFNTKYKIVADYDWILKVLVKNKATCKYLGFMTTVFTDEKGMSSVDENRTLHKAERFEVQKIYFPLPFVIFSNFIYRSMRSLLRFPITRCFFTLGFSKNRVDFS